MFEGLSLRHDRGALVRSVLEGVAYGLRDSLELLQELGVSPAVGPRVRRRRPQRALAEDRRLRPRHPDRADGGRGGRRLRRGAPRRASPAATFATAQEAVDACVRVRDTVEPDPGWQRVYDEGYERFRSLYPAIKGVP